MTVTTASSSNGVISGVSTSDSFTVVVKSLGPVITHNRVTYSEGVGSLCPHKATVTYPKGQQNSFSSIYFLKLTVIPK